MKKEMKMFLDAVTFEEPVYNDDNAVFLFSVKRDENSRKTLIKTGLFNGNEEFIRMRIRPSYSKMECNQYTIIFINGEAFEWQTGGGSHTLVSDKITETGQLIKETVYELCKTNFSEITVEDFVKRFSK